MVGRDYPLVATILAFGVVAVLILLPTVAMHNPTAFAPILRWFLEPPVDPSPVTETPYKDAFIAIASVSAVMWTGGLILMQLRQGLNPHNEIKKKDNLMKMVIIRGAMACIAFGMLAPLFMLFVTGPWVRAVSGIFFVYYLATTAGNVGIYRRALQKNNDDLAMAATLMFMPTLAIFAVVIAPLPITVASASTFLAFVGYVRLSESVNML